MLVPLNKNLIIRRIEPSTKTSSGIILQVSMELDKAEVIAVSADIDTVNVGEQLLINWNKAYKIKDDTYKIHIDDVVAVFRD